MKYLFLLALVFCLSCSHDTKAVLEEIAPPSAEVSVSVINRPDRYKEFRNGTDGPYTPIEIAWSYFDDDGIQVKWVPEESGDIRSFKVNRAVVEVSLRHRAFTSRKYYLFDGDSLVVEFKDKVPNGLIYHGDLIRTDVSRHLAETIYENDYPAYRKLEAPFFFVPFDFERNSPDEFETALQEFVQEEQQKDKIQSVRALKLLNKLQEEDQIGDLEYFLRVQDLAHRLSKYDIDLKGSLIKNDQYQDLIYYQSYFDEYLDKAIADYGKKVNEIRLPNGVHPDFEELYLYLEKTDRDSIEKLRMHRKVLENLINTSNSITSEQFIDRHLNNYRDQVYAAYLFEQYDLNYSVGADLLIEDTASDTFALAKVLDSLRDKVVYVDFWASWCFPRRESLPASKEMRKDPELKEVEFVYMGINDTPQRWQKAILDEGLGNTKNYRVLHQRSSPWIDKYAVSSIPRYMIFDRSGKLVFSNAPGPGAAAKEQLLKALAL